MKSDKLSSFALAIAAIVLLVVGAISYRDYLKAKYEKEFGPAAQAQVQTQTVTAGAPQGQLPPQTQANQMAPAPALGPDQALPPGVDPGRIPPSPVPGNLQTNTAAAPAGQPPSAIQTASESRLSRYQEDLKTLQQENAIYREKLAETRSGTPLGSPVPDAVQPGNPGMPNSAVSAVSGNTGLPVANPTGAPSPQQQQQQQLTPKVDEQQISALSEKIRKEASVAKVVEFDPEWAFLVISGGRDRGIEQEMRFAVRRGSEILGWVKITEVEHDRSVAQLMSGNKDSRTARKPEPGDDIIAFNLF